MPSAQAGSVVVHESAAGPQFGVTITYHFLFVPLAIGLAFLVATMQVLRDRHVEAFTGSARLAAGMALVCTVLVMVTAISRPG